MPRKRSQSERRALILACGSVVVALGLLLGIAYLVNRGKVETKNIGDQVFEVGDAKRLAAEIEDRGPFLFSDVSGRGVNDVYVVHAGESVETSWRAIDAGDRGCTLEWTGVEFRDPCTEEVFPLSGEGLTIYETTVTDDGDVVVDLRKRAG